jgi:hypothetical protein
MPAFPLSGKDCDVKGKKLALTDKVISIFLAVGATFQRNHPTVVVLKEMQFAHSRKLEKILVCVNTKGH